MLQLILLAFLVLLAVRWWRDRQLPPGPFGLPIVGYLPWMDPKVPYETLMKLSKKYGPVYGLYLGNVYTVVLTDARDVRNVLAKDAFSGRAPLYVTHGIMKGYGIICTEGELWKDQRKFVHACLRQFGAAKVSPKRGQMESIIMGEVQELVENIKLLGKSAILDPEIYLRHSVGSVMNKLTFGTSWEINDKTWLWLQHLQEEGTKHIGVAGPLNFLPFLRFVPKFRKTMEFLLEGKYKTHRFYQTLIDQMQAEIEQGGNENTDNVIAAFLKERKKRQDTPDLEKFYNDQQFYHVLADFFGAGLDTTLTTLRWYLLYMALNPDIQSKIQEEIDNVMKGNPLTLEDLSSLPLTEASLAEAQRIRSVVPLGIPHGTIRNTYINDYKIPVGTMVVPLQWAIHMEGKLWSCPEEYNPWRFINEEGRFVKPDNFIPFQTGNAIWVCDILRLILGKRMCVGEELARMLLFLFGATILLKFNLKIPPEENVDTVGECGITLTPKKHRLVFETRSESDE